MLIFDIGSNLGSYSIEWSKKGKVISVEASPFIFKQLKRKTKTYKNIIPLNYAVCETNDELIKLFYCDVHTLSTIDERWLKNAKSRFFDWPKRIVEIDVPTITLDILIETYGIPDLIKIDVEGSEYRVLQSLTKKVPMMCLEWVAEWRPENELCIDYASNLGFTKFHIQDCNDEYSYVPKLFDLTTNQCKAWVRDVEDKIDWGMMWFS